MSEKLYRIKTDLNWLASEVDDRIETRTPVGGFAIQLMANGCYLAMDYSGRSIRCASMDEAKQVAQYWYAERMREGLEEVPQAEINHEAMDRLEKWNRKGYHFDIRNSGNFHPGDGFGVTLRCSWMDKEKHSDAGRKVDVLEDEMIRWANDEGEDYFPTIAEVILEALRKWEQEPKS